MIELSTICVPIPSDQKQEIQFCRTHHPLQQDEAPLQLAAVQLSHCVWGLHAWGPRGSDPTAGEVTAADPVPTIRCSMAVICGASWITPGFDRVWWLDSKSDPCTCWQRLIFLRLR